MITYNFSIRGKSHVRSNTVCQDSSKTGKLHSGFYMAIVADGVGSALHSEIGSSLAVDSLYTYCDQYITKNSQWEEIRGILQAGYEYAMDQISRYVSDQAGNIQDYDTTLSSVIYDGKTLVYGHAGDGGIIVRCQNGETRVITQRQKGADGVSVRPLRSGNTSWEFGVVDTLDIEGVLLATDGMLDGVFQPVLLNLPKSRMELVKNQFSRNHAYITAAEFFMNPYCVYRNRSVKEPGDVISHFLEGELEAQDQSLFIDYMMNGYKQLFHGQDHGQDMERIRKSIEKYYYAVWSLCEVDDDKSVAVLINDKCKVTPREVEYYCEAEWKQLNEHYENLLYNRVSDTTEKPILERPKPEPVINPPVDEPDKNPGPVSNNLNFKVNPKFHVTSLPEDSKKKRKRNKTARKKKRGSKFIRMGMCVLILGIAAFTAGGIVGHKLGVRTESKRQEKLLAAKQKNIDKCGNEIKEKKDDNNEQLKQAGVELSINQVLFTMSRCKAKKAAEGQKKDFWDAAQKCGAKSFFENIIQESEPENTPMASESPNPEENRNMQEDGSRQDESAEIKQDEGIDLQDVIDQIKECKTFLEDGEEKQKYFQPQYNNLSSEEQTNIKKLLTVLKQNDNSGDEGART